MKYKKQIFRLKCVRECSGVKFLDKNEMNENGKSIKNLTGAESPTCQGRERPNALQDKLRTRRQGLCFTKQDTTTPCWQGSQLRTLF